MNNNKKVCPDCNKPLKPSQFARRILEGQQAMKASDNLVCRNYPECQKAEVEPRKDT